MAHFRGVSGSQCEQGNLTAYSNLSWDMANLTHRALSTVSPQQPEGGSRPPATQKGPAAAQLQGRGDGVSSTGLLALFLARPWSGGRAGTAFSLAGQPRPLAQAGTRVPFLGTLALCFFPSDEGVLTLPGTRD